MIHLIPDNSNIGRKKSDYSRAIALKGLVEWAMLKFGFS